MTYKAPLLIAEESKRRERLLLRARYKAQNPKVDSKGRELDRTIGMHVVVNTAGTPEAKEQNKKASALYRKCLKTVQKDKNGKPILMSKQELRSRCLEITRSHA